MNRSQWTALGVGLGLMGLAAGVLSVMGASHRLGKPGLKLVEEPTYMTNGVVARHQSVSLPVEVLDYTSESVGLSPVEVDWLPQDTLFGRREYHGKDGFRALASVVLMGTDRTSIHKPQFCLDGQGWRIDSTETVSIPIQRPHPYDLQVMKLTSSKVFQDVSGQPIKARGVYVYWFVADDQLTPHHGERMWWMARDLIRTGVLQRWAYVSYFSICPPGLEDACFARMADLIAASVPEFQLAAGPVSATRSNSAKASGGGSQERN